MNTATSAKPFTSPFLSQLTLNVDALPFSDRELVDLDNDLDQYEELFLDPDIEKNLLSKNELLASFAISKAENSTLTLLEARDVYDFLLKNEEYSFISEKLKKGEKLLQKDYEKLEFFNIAKTFKEYQEIKIEEVTPHFIRQLHQKLTQGLDVFQQYLPHFDVYKPGKWRDNDKIRVGTYTPAAFNQIETSVEELLVWIKKSPTVTNVGIFHTALYALHPFNNGNKRVSRILEHIFLRTLKVNTKNLYSTSYYYHKEKARYYKYLLFSLERKNLNHFANFFQEAFALSILSVIKTSLEVKRKAFLDSKDVDDHIRLVCNPLVKRGEIQFKNLFRIVHSKMVRQTFVTYLQQATDQGILSRRVAGKATYYRLNISLQEESTFHKMLSFIKTKQVFISDEIKLS